MKKEAKKEVEKHTDEKKVVKSTKETKRIKWTNGKDLVKYSVAAVVFVIFFGIYFYGIDWIVLLIRKLANN